MKKLILFAICAILSAAIMYLTNCSRPLDSNDITQTDHDTLFMFDTTNQVDTIYVDTSGVDTIFIDTTFYDTVFVDTLLCARLSSHRQEVVWMLFNQEGHYQLEFQALTERIHHSQTLIVDIDGESFSWIPADNPEFAVETDLEHHALIRISSVPPHAYGQAIDICFSISTPINP